MSYTRSKTPDRDFYLFLVDPAVVKEPRRTAYEDNALRPSKLSWWVPCARHTRGLPIAQAYDNTDRLDLASMLTGFAHSRSNYKLLFVEDASMDSAVFLHFFASTSFDLAYRYLNSRIKSISFGKLVSSHDPGPEDIDRLHVLREHVNTLDETISAAKSYIHEIIEDVQVSYDRKTFRVQAGETLEKVRRLDAVVMNTLPLITASLAASEAREAKLLTRLAATYLPISLATSIYGMNIAEINDSKPSAWIAAITLVVIGFLTLLLIVGGSSSQRKKLYSLPASLYHNISFPKRNKEPDEQHDH